mmetsp:Transcript_31247/g.71939  ORF Transcript_31247/g.71939 Transcript_31247/m.71939 type:complete len:94 (-) Transcript_31247:210-491(-)
MGTVAIKMHLPDGLFTTCLCQRHSLIKTFKRKREGQGNSITGCGEIVTRFATVSTLFVLCVHGHIFYAIHGNLFGGITVGVYVLGIGEKDMGT